jgi:hypothetical protein
VWWFGAWEESKGSRQRRDFKVITLKRSYSRRRSGKRAGLSYLLTFYLMYILVEFESFLVSVAMFLIVWRSFVRSFVRELACKLTLCTTACPYAPLCCGDRTSIHKYGGLTAKKILAGALGAFSGVIGWLVGWLVVGNASIPGTGRIQKYGLAWPDMGNGNEGYTASEKEQR